MKKQLTLGILLALWYSFLTINTTQASCTVADKHLNFVENKGQWPAHIHYQAELPASRLFVESNQLTYVLYKPEDLARIHEIHHNPSAATTEADKLINVHAFQVQISGAKVSPTLESSCKTEAYRNYFIGKDASKWASKVGLFHQIDYRELYEGIDMRLYSKDGNMKYDFIVAPNADVNQITLEYKGADGLFVENGQLHIETSVNTIIEQTPYVYQHIDGKEVIIPCQFRVYNNKVWFEFPEGYHKSEELIIDPELVFSTFTGSNADNWGFTATYDNEGNMYAGGIAFGSGYPTTLGAFQIAFAGGSLGQFGRPTDISISKFTADGSQLIYSTYIGGSNGNEMPHSMIVNEENELIILGTTGSSDYPTTNNAFDRTFAGGRQTSINAIDFPFGSDIILSKLNSEGISLMGSTFLGGSENDGLNLSDELLFNYGDESRGEVVVDEDGYIYGASCTRSDNFSVTSGSFQTNFGGGTQDACIFKFKPDLSALEWSSYLGGSTNDAAYSIKVADNGTLYVGGGTRSSNFPSTSSALNNSYLGGNADGFVVHINTVGSGILQATYLGTSDKDQVYFLDIDGAGEVYALGQTFGNYSVQGDVYDNTNSGQFIHKLSDDLRTTRFSTVFGRGDGDPDISPSAFLVDTCNQIYVSGWGGITGNVGNSGFITSGLPVTNGAFQTTTDGKDFYFMVLSENAQSLSYATFFGGVQSGDNQSGEHVDGGTSRFAKNGAIYQAICAGCGGFSDLPTTPGVWSNNNQAGNCNLGAVKFALTGPVANFNTQSGGCSFTVQFENNSVNAETFDWDFGDGATSTEIHPNHEYAEAGSYEVRLIVTKAEPCFLSDTLVQTVTLEGTVANVNIEAQQFCVGDPETNLAADVPGGTWSGQGILDPNTGLFSPNIGVGEYTVIYTIISGDCEVSDTEIISVSEAPDASFETLQESYCSLDDIGIALNPVNEGGTFTGNGVENNTFVPANVTNITRVEVLVEIDYEVTVNGCTAESSQSTIVYFPPSSEFGAINFCEGDEPQILNPAIEDGEWSGEGVDSETGLFEPTTAGTYSITYTTGVENCTQSTTKDIIVYALADASFEAPDFCLNDEAMTLVATALDGEWSGEGVNSETGIFDPSTVGVGSYEITYTVTDDNGCVASTTETITVIDVPDATFTARDFCQNEEAAAFEASISGGAWSGEGVNSETGVFDPATVDIGTYEINYAVGAGGCSAEETQLVSVFATPDASFTAVDFCENEEAAALEPTVSGGIWSGEGVDSETGVFDPSILEIGSYEITYSLTDENECTASITQTINVFAAPDASFLAGDFCENGEITAFQGTVPGGIWSSDEEGIIDGETGIFDPGILDAGSYEITYSITDENGCSAATTEIVNIVALPDASFTVLDFCENDEAASFETAFTGGTWSGEGIDSETGIFDPSIVGVGSYEISYSIFYENVCVSFTNETVNVFATPDAGFTAMDFCSGGEPQALQANTQGGIWSGQGIDPQTGIFDPNTVEAGSYEITYSITDENGCSAATTQTVRVSTTANATFTARDFCLGDAPQALQANTQGGTWSGQGIDPQTGIFNPNTLGVGSYEITYSLTDENGCGGSSTQTINVFALPDASFITTNFCKNDAARAFQPNVIGGVWSGQGIDPQTGVFDPNVTSAGLYQITYTITIGNCTNSSTQTISVYELPTANFTPVDFCVNSEPFALTPFNPGGIWSGEGIDPQTGVFDPATVGAGSYFISYTTFDANGCSNTSSGFVDVYAQPEINILQEAYCLDGTDTFEITFSVSGGTSNSFELTGDISQIIAANEAFTAVFVSGTEPTIIVRDVQTYCGARLELNAIPTCIACEPDAGTMPIELQITCAEGSTDITTMNPIVEEGQVIAYAVHSSSTFSENEILAINTTGSFAFDDLENASYYEEYYVSAIVGFPLNEGLPVIGDICTVISSTNTPILFLAPVSFNIDEFCDGETADYIVTVAVEGGLPQYDNNFTYYVFGDFAGEVALGETFTVVYSSGTTDSYNFSTTINSLGCEGGQIISEPFECTKTPIELLEFTGEVQTEGNLLKWFTASEVNNDYFVLERSSNGFDFEPIATIKGAGTSFEPNFYSFLDKEAVNLNLTYYRYRQVDFNGTETLSYTISLTRGEITTDLIAVFPNPIKDKAVISFTSSERNKNIQLSLFDISGRKVWTKNVVASYGFNREEIDLSDFSSGVYLLQLSVQEHFSIQKIIKQ